MRVVSQNIILLYNNSSYQVSKSWSIKTYLKYQNNQYKNNANKKQRKN